MLMINVLPFVALAVLVVGAKPSNEDSESRSNRPFFDGAKRSLGPHDTDAGTEVKEKLKNHPEGSLAHQVTTREAKVTGKNNGRAFAGNWRSSQENARYSNTPKKFRSNFKVHPQEGLHDVSKKSVGRKTFTRMLLQQPRSQQALMEAMGSTFIQGMVKGELNPAMFSAFELQDAVYLSEARNILSRTASQITSTNPGFANMYNIQAGKYDKEYRRLLKEKNMIDVSCVSPRPITRRHVDYLGKLSATDPRFLAIGVLPCSQFWRTISEQLIKQVNPSSEYKEWFQANLRGPDYESDLEKFINEKSEEGVIKEKEILDAYFEGMENEMNFIIHAGEL